MNNLTEFVGEECLPIKLFRDQKVVELNNLLDDQGGLRDTVIDRCFTRGSDFEQTKNQIAGIINACLAVLESNDFRKKQRLERAVAQFRVAFPKIQEHFAICNETEYKKNGLNESLSKDACSVVVDDLRIRLLAQQKSTVKPPTGSVVQTPVFIAHGNTASVFLLSVELISDGRVGIFPDIYSIGALTISEDFEESVCRIWRLAEMGNRRAIWKITKFSLFDDKDLHPKPISIFSLEGRSMEAAFLSALWALRGGIPGDKVFQFDSSLPMERLVGVTGKVLDDLKDDRPGSYLIERVQSTDYKLHAARRNNLDTVVVASLLGDTKDTEQQSVNQLTEQYGIEKRELQDARTDQQQKANATDYGGLTVLELETARDVFDSLLVTNRWLASWQDETRKNWLKQWESRPKGEDGRFVHGGARAPGDEALGPDDENAPRATEQE